MSIKVEVTLGIWDRRRRTEDARWPRQQRALSLAVRSFCRLTSRFAALDKTEDASQVKESGTFHLTGLTNADAPDFALPSNFVELRP